MLHHLVQGVVCFFFLGISVEAFVDEGLKVFILVVVLVLAESAVAGESVALITFLLVVVE